MPFAVPAASLRQCAAAAVGNLLVRQDFSLSVLKGAPMCFAAPVASVAGARAWMAAETHRPSVHNALAKSSASHAIFASHVARTLPHTTERHWDRSAQLKCVVSVKPSAHANVC